MNPVSADDTSRQKAFLHGLWPSFSKKKVGESGYLLQAFIEGILYIIINTSLSSS